MATYIFYGDGEGDTRLQGADWLQNIILQQKGETALKEFQDKFKNLGDNADDAMVFDLFVEYSDDLFSAIPETRGDERVKEVESFFALVFSMLLMLDEEEKIDQDITRLCQIFTSRTDQQPELRLRLLMMLYNTFIPELVFRFRVFKYILDYAHSSNLFDQVVPYLEYLDSWMVDWEQGNVEQGYMSDDDKRTLYLDISTYLRALGKRVDAFLHLKKYHMLFQDVADATKDKKVYASTVQLLSDAVSLPSVIQFDDILSYSTVKALAKSKDSKDKPLVQLCEIFLQGSVNDLRDFHKKHGALFEDQKLVFEDAMSKIKLLTLATMAHNRSEMTLAEVAAKLDESEENVERWVVRAISEGIIDGRIDQLNHKVLVKSAFQRKFEKGEWAFLDSKLTQWIDNLENVIKFIGEQKAMKEAAGLVSAEAPAATS